MTTECFVGIDVSKDSLEVAIYDQETLHSFANTPGHVELVAYLKPSNPTLIVMEASGGFEIEAALALMSGGLSVAVVNPSRVRSFARAYGQLAKTDPIDTHVLAHFAQAVRPRVRSLQSEQETHLTNLVRRRRQVVVMLAEKNRLHTTSIRLKDGVKKHILWLQEEEIELTKQIAELIQTLPQWREKIDFAECAWHRSGQCGYSAGRTARIGHHQTAENRRSGRGRTVQPRQWQEARSPQNGGRAGKGVRSAFYMACLSASQHNPVIKRFYDRLIANGKETKVALTACMRKLSLRSSMPCCAIWNPGVWLICMQKHLDM